MNRNSQEINDLIAFLNQDAKLEYTVEEGLPEDVQNQDIVDTYKYNANIDKIINYLYSVKRLLDVVENINIASERDNANNF